MSIGAAAYRNLKCHCQLEWLCNRANQVFYDGFILVPGYTIYSLFLASRFVSVMNSEEHRLTASTEKQLKRRPEGRGYLKSEVDDLIDGCTALYGSIYIMSSRTAI